MTHEHTQAPPLSFDGLLEQMRVSSDTPHEQGKKFEQLMCEALPLLPEYDGHYKRAVLWNEWELHEGPDVGVDLVAELADGGGWCAVQCKFYGEATRVNKKEVADFVAASQKPFKNEDGENDYFKERIIISTSDDWGPHAEAGIRDLRPAVVRLGMKDFRSVDINWSDFGKEKLKPAPKKKKTLFTHQQKAKDAVVGAFVEQKEESGKLIMACGSGKTFTALKIAEEEKMAGKDGTVLFLVPSISLLSQSLSDFARDRDLPHQYLVVCSDSKVGKKSDDISTSDLMFPPTTNPEDIAAKLRKKNGRMTVVFSTYHSLDAVAKAQSM